MTSSENLPEITPEIQETLKALASTIGKGKTTIADVWSSITTTPQPSAVVGERTAPTVKAITEAQRAALTRLPYVYGQVSPTKDRILSAEELREIVEERDVIDLILGLVKSRKDESIRETLANHLDHLHLAEDHEPGEECSHEYDGKGHVIVKQEVSVPGAGRKIQKTHTDPKPQLTAEGALRAYEEGAIDRKTYLAITRIPDVPRVLDEEGLVKSVKKDPNLMWALAKYTHTPNKTITVKVINE